VERMNLALPRLVAAMPTPLLGCKLFYVVYVFVWLRCVNTFLCAPAFRRCGAAFTTRRWCCFYCRGPCVALKYGTNVRNATMATNGLRNERM